MKNRDSEGLETGLQSDLQTRLLYSTDASMYQIVPESVAFPASADELKRLVETAKHHKTSITARAAATSLAGQTVGRGIIADVSRHLTRILEINPEEKSAWVEPGVIRDTLNREAGKHGLHFAPDPATSNRCMFGGMIGNNSSGSFSLRYGTTKDHVLELETVLANGEIASFMPVSTELLLSDAPAGLEVILARKMYRLVEKHQELIRRVFPKPELKRSNAGYGLDRLLQMKPFVADGPDFSLVPLLCGSEGTLALTAKAKIKLTPTPKNAVLLVPQFASIDTAMRATVEALAFDPSAIELVDDHIISATYGNPSMESLRFFLKGSPKCFLIIQFDDSGKFDPLEQAEKLSNHFKKQGFTAVNWIEKDAANQKKIWELRKAGLGLLMGLSSESKSPTFCEDTAVPVENLPAYIRDFQDLLKKYDSSCVFYAHASVGELHLRPVLDLKQPGNIARMVSMQEEITDLVKKYGGTISGEHGDGRARSAFLEQLYGTEMLAVFAEVKRLFDPENRLNPGVIVSADGFTENLRYTDKTMYQNVPTQFGWRAENGFHEALERCNGAGVCRKVAESGGTMCPSYRATKEERDSTRGRANLFRQVFNGNQKDGFSSEDLKDALDLCLGCKACKTECPAGVDMTRMKSEFLHGWHQKKGAKFGDRLMAFAHKTNFWIRILPQPLKMIMVAIQNTWVFRKITGLDPKRPLPVPAPKSYRQLFWKSFNPKPGPQVFLFVDHYTDIYEPQTAVSAQQVLEKLGYQVQVLKMLTAGRALLSLGFPEDAKKIMNAFLDELEIAELFKIPVIGLEPSEVLTVRDDYPDLCVETDLERVKKLAPTVFLFEEFVANQIHPNGLRVLQAKKRTPVYIHGHCHAKALSVTKALVDVFQKTGFEPQFWDTGCCGMAGAFGYQEGKAALSMDIGEQTLFPKVRAVEDDALICAHGFSCRHQIADGVQREALHPARILAQNIPA